MFKSPPTQPNSLILPNHNHVIVMSRQSWDANGELEPTTMYLITMQYWDSQVAFEQEVWGFSLRVSASIPSKNQ